MRKASRSFHCDRPRDTRLISFTEKWPLKITPRVIYQTNSKYYFLLHFTFSYTCQSIIPLTIGTLYFHGMNNFWRSNAYHVVFHSAFDPWNIKTFHAGLYLRRFMIHGFLWQTVQPNRVWRILVSISGTGDTDS